ncbi:MULTISPECIES: hypothetical protein [unclassified Aureispira]|uniref:hypothetical protein n=1 Tax=unclassified Aureispira TaxID=2649989 RepID=UPI0006980C22|nr:MULTISPECIES: hypothetical protein [unclassified Aureispira]WMX15561.1 hypothetical protein QP953_04110 [Aureispira sp. CCB-E]
MKFYYLIFLFLLTACANETSPSTNVETVTDTLATNTEVLREVEENTTVSDENQATPNPPDSIPVPSFAIHFDFSEGVQKILDSGKERLVVDIALSGLPKDVSNVAGKDYYNEEDEQIYLKSIALLYEQNETQTMHIENLNISKEALDALQNPNYMITINFYSSRTSSDNNIFSANALIEEVNSMKNKTHTIKVKML